MISKGALRLNIKWYQIKVYNGTNVKIHKIESHRLNTGSGVANRGLAPPPPIFKNVTS